MVMSLQGRQSVNGSDSIFRRRFPLAAVRNALLEHGPQVAVELRPVDAALGCVLARTEQAMRPLPSTAIALVDGWAVAAADTFAASPYSPVPVDHRHPLDIGAPVPDGCDAVVRRDAVVLERRQPMLQTPLAAGENLRRMGEDVKEGNALLAAGCRLTPLTATLAGLAGLTSVAIRSPRALILHGAAGETAAKLVATALGKCGAACRVVAIGTPGDPPEDFSPHLTIAIGGATIGCDDQALARLAAAKDWQVIGCPAMRPGDTVVCGLVGGRPAVVVPSRLDAVLSTLLLLIGPVIGALAGAGDQPLRQRRALTRKISSTVGLSELVLLADGADESAWTPIGTGAFDWIAGVSARAFAEIPPESEGVGEGEYFEATLLSGPGAIGLWSET